MENLKITKEIATENMEKRKDKAKQRYDQHSKLPTFQLFDKVLLKNHQVPIGLSPKLVDKYDGPYFISELGPNYTYKVRRCSDRKEHKSFMNAQQLKHYHDPAIYRQIRNNDNDVDNDGNNDVANDVNVDQNNDDNVDQRKSERQC